MVGLQRGFEMNAPTTTASIELVQNLWTPSKPYSFLNPTALDGYWSKAATAPAKLTALLDMIHVDAPGLSLDDLITINAWLKAWRHNELMSLFVLRGWLAPNNATIETFDLDPRTPTIDTGFELRWEPAMATTSYPTLSQAQYLWHDANEYSFLAPNTDNVNVGFGAWVQAYTGEIPSSERLLDVMPPLGQTSRRHQVANATIVANIQAATGLTAAQIQAIASWLLSWPDHSFLWRDVLSQWSTQTTQFSDSPARWNVASVDTTGGSANLSGFELPVPLSAGVSISMAQARLLWDIYTPYSFLNPKMLVVWCFASASVATGCIVRDSKPADVQEAIYTIGYVWLLQLLDSQDFYRYLNQRVGAPPSSAIRGLATQQWINGTVLNSTAVASQADVRTTDAWNATIQAVETVALPTMGGPPELMTFCNRRSSTEPSCSLGTGYVIDDAAASAMLSRFTDQTKVSVHGLTFARGVVVLDVFLAQPFGTLDECVSHAASLGSMFSTPTPTPATNATANSTNTTNSTSMCYQYLTQQSTPLDQFAINIAPLPAVSLAQLRDWQAYLWHIATKLGYDRPSVLPHGSYFTHQSIRSLLWANPATDSVAPTSTLPLPNIEFPVAESLAQRTPLVANVTANQTTTTISLGLSSTKYGCVIAQVASASTGPGSSIEYQDPSCGYTDGSVFPPGAPSSLSFFWSFGRQVLSLSFSTVTTRFGVALRRYVWPTAWLRFNPALYDDLPVTLTSPHLYNLSSPALPFASGLTPDAQTHTSVVDVEPLTGLVLHSRINWQVNVQIGPTTKWFPNVTASFLPVFWFRRERAAAASAFSSYMDLTDAGPFAPEKVAIWEVVWGVLFVGASAVLFRRMHLTRQRSVRLIQPDHVDGYSSANVDALIHATADDGKRQQ
ncbi:hypothetical protein DYB32_002663 [Aphanomyces invadans]|uniref:Uncharacterized protein n=1 Tax=Aphanomyces invadans TaxID=157072 RepID=A0A3R6Z2A7_9STRA|nr:hypothetical protein DYB32_002663 [Aphanomyces invadans]